MSPIAYEHGRQDGKNGYQRSECPLEYKKDRALHSAWLHGYADQAKAEADEAMAKYKLEPR